LVEEIQPSDPTLTPGSVESEALGVGRGERLDEALALADADALADAVAAVLPQPGVASAWTALTQAAGAIACASALGPAKVSVDSTTAMDTAGMPTAKATRRLSRARAADDGAAGPGFSGLCMVAPYSDETKCGVEPVQRNPKKGRQG
jgi:hypothetical protein